MNGSADRITRRQCLGLIAGAAAASLAPALCRAENDSKLLRVAISAETLAGANINDARAAYLLWIDAVSREFGHSTAVTVPGLFIPTEEMIRGIRQGTIDCYGVTALELAKIADLTDPGEVVLQDYLAEGIEYVLLVHNGSKYKTVADLRGAQMLTHLHRDMVLLQVWLGTLLAANSLPPAERFFGSLSPRDKVNQVLLPVFFRNADGACLARRSWETAVELNPQLGRDLRALAVSPKIIPIAIGFRRNCDAIGRKALIDSMLRISNSNAGQQITAFYGARRFVVRPASCMKETLEMVRQFERVSAQRAGPRKGKS
jgi:ABC-type phosphate/phosphonate transport system substrate-binding protein